MESTFGASYHPAFLLVGKSSKKKLPIWSAGMSRTLHRPAISRAVNGSLPVIRAVRVLGGMPALRAASACDISSSAKRTRRRWNLRYIVYPSLSTSSSSGTPSAAAMRFAVLALTLPPFMALLRHGRESVISCAS